MWCLKIGIDPPIMAISRGKIMSRYQVWEYPILRQSQEDWCGESFDLAVRLAVEKGNCFTLRFE